MVFPPETDGPQEAPCGRGSDYCTPWTSWSMASRVMGAVT